MVELAFEAPACSAGFIVRNEFAVVAIAFEIEQIAKKLGFTVKFINHRRDDDSDSGYSFWGNIIYVSIYVSISQAKLEVTRTELREMLAQEIIEE